MPALLARIADGYCRVRDQVPIVIAGAQPPARIFRGIDRFDVVDAEIGPAGVVVRVDRIPHHADGHAGIPLTWTVVRRAAGAELDGYGRLIDTGVDHAEVGVVI